MRIALFCDGVYPYVVGGMQKHSYELARYLGAMGVQVDLYAALPPDQMVRAWREPLYQEPVSGVTVRFVARPELLYFPTHYLLGSKIISQRLLDAYCAAERADFLYAQGFTPWTSKDESIVQLVDVSVDPFTGNITPIFATAELSGFRLVDARASYGIGLQTFALGFPMHFDWSWRTLFNKQYEDLVYFQMGGSEAFRKPKFSFWIGYDF